MLKEFLLECLNLKRPEIVRLGDGREYSTIGLTAMMDATPGALKVSTLTALVDYFTSGVDDAEECIVQICSPTLVNLISTLTPAFAQRHTLMQSVFTPTRFQFGQYMELERLNIGLLSEFAPNGPRDALLSVLSKIKTDNGVTYEDDGITQKVTVKNGVASIGQQSLPKTVKLKPYRTFLEIEQPEGEYLLRLKQSGEGANFSITGAIIEADGGKWELTAMQSIKTWLAERLPVDTILLA